MTKSTLADRFWSKVRRGSPDECWPWLAHGTRTGYGMIRLHDGARWTNEYAHRVAWFLEHGDMPTGHVLHRCDNPPCVNPAHLFGGTHLDNIADKVAKGRQQRGERVSTHRLTSDDVRAIREMRDVSSYVIGPRYGISPRYARDIRNRKAWAWLPD